MRQRLENNIAIDYVFRFVSSFDLSSGIWVLYLVFKGLPLWQIGLLEGIFHVVSFISEVPTGAAADLLGRKKVILLGRICSALSCIIMLFATNFWHFAFGFLFSAWGYNLLSGSEEALVYDSLKLIGKEDTYRKVNGRLEMIINIAQGAGTFIGGILAEKSYYYCYGAAVMICLTSLIPAFFLKEPELLIDKKMIEKVSIKAHFRSSYNVVKKSPAIMETLLSYSLIFTFYMISYFYGQKYFSDLGLNKIEISVVMLVTGIMSCLGAMVSDKVSQLLKNHTKNWAIVIIAFGMLGLAVGRIDVSIACFFIMGFTNTLLYPLQSDTLNRLIPSEQRATIISVNSMTYSLFMLILFPIVGVLAGIFGLRFVFVGLGIIEMVISFVI